MGQKVNPHGLRVGVIKDWDSKWYAEDNFADNLVEDYNIRKFLKKKLYAAGISKIETERASDRLKIIIHTAKPGVVIGKGGAEIESLKKQVEKLTDAKRLSIDIKEVRRPDKDAQLVAENIASQLENRISFRRAMKSCMGRTMKHLVLDVLAVLIWLVQNFTAKVQFHFRHFVLISTMDLQKQIQHTVKLVLRYGFMKERYFQLRLRPMIIRKGAINNVTT